MILKKVVNGDNVIYVPISFEEALNYENKNELEFTDEDERDEFEEHLEELEELEEDIEDINERIDDLNKKTGHKSGFDFSEFGKFFENIGNLFTNKKKNTSKSKKLIAALPFLDEEDLHEIVEEILNNSSDYEDLDLVTVMPFLSQKDCDELFMKLVIDKNNQNRYKLSAMGPFISNECLSKLVDEYINGNCQDIQMDTLYPFMNSKDVKRLFKYIISQKNND